MTKGGRKFFFGFIPKRDSEGQPAGSAILQIKTRNAYELLGLRRPLGSPSGKP